MSYTDYLEAPHFALICLISRAYTVPTQTKNGLQHKLQPIDLNGGPSRDRTEDLLIKSP